MADERPLQGLLLRQSPGGNELEAVDGNELEAGEPVEGFVVEAQPKLPVLQAPGEPLQALRAGEAAITSSCATSGTG